MTNKHKNFYLQQSKKKSLNKLLIFIGVVGIGLLIFLIWFFTRSKGVVNVQYGSPGHWSQEQLTNYKKKMQTKSGLPSGVSAPSSIINCIVDQVSKTYSYNDAISDKISDSDHNKILKKCIGNNWNEDIKNFFISILTGNNISKNIATCIVDKLSSNKKYTPFEVISCSEDPKDPKDPKESYCNTFTKDMETYTNDCITKK